VRNSIGLLLALAIGSLLGFFGVFVSVFADGGLGERLLTIAVILLIYFVLSALWGFLLPRHSWLWGLALAAPGAIILALYMLREYNPYYFIYIVLIIGLAILGAYLGSSLRKRKSKES
jgi:cation transport ATPase